MTFRIPYFAHPHPHLRGLSPSNKPVTVLPCHCLVISLDGILIVPYSIVGNIHTLTVNFFLLRLAEILSCQDVCRTKSKHLQFAE